MITKRFRIEQLDAANSNAPAMTVTGQSTGHADTEMILAAIRDLKKAIEPQEQLTSSMLEKFQKEFSEAQKLRSEIDEIYNAIESTKTELASIHEGSLSGDRMSTVTGELDAIVSGTEQATDTILGAAEEIDQAANDLAASLKGSHHDLANDIREQILLIFEASNFQDLTGQRITKVVNTLKFIEERIIRMMEIWGGMEAFSEIEADLPQAEGDAALLHGPGHEDDPDRINQDDIDALFD